jgi:phenylpyruvate tautomerase PptA (4-oxalocrotonate tautomerase family)
MPFSARAAVREIGRSTMPLMKFDVIEGRDQAAIQKLLDAAHRAMVKSFGAPERDRFQIVYQHPAHEMVIQDVGLGFKRTKDVVIVSVTSKKRTEEQKLALYTNLADELSKHCGLDPQDLMVSLVINDREDWSFGLGEAQFITGKL